MNKKVTKNRCFLSKTAVFLDDDYKKDTYLKED